MRLIRALIAGLSAMLLAPAGSAAAQPVTSAGPDKVAVTIYRGNSQGQGFALVTETRTVTIPRGRAVIRFEGVAGGILPESAIVTGLPAGVREKNLDAELLSPHSLYAGSLGRPVTLRRTIGGQVSEERAILRSGPNGAAILETSSGFVAANCVSGQREVIVYNGVPAGLSAKPTLSVETEGGAEQRVTLTLSYLAWGFDWQANYVATMRPDGRSAELIAWVTLDSNDVTSFADAEAMVVAGKVERSGDASAAPDYRAEELRFRCFFRPYTPMAPPAPLPEVGFDGDVVVTGYRASLQSAMDMKSSISVMDTVEREDLGDLNLYRVPHRTTIAAKSRKQVGLLNEPSVAVEVFYRVDISGIGPQQPARIVLRTHNRKDKGLGMPLPSGEIALFEPFGGARMLVGESYLADKAVGEEVEVEIAQSSQVTATQESGERDTVTVTNANPFPVRFEGRFNTDGAGRISGDAKITRKNGRHLWTTTVPANGRATLRYRFSKK